jgi:hypothetical protein
LPVRPGLNQRYLSVYLIRVRRVLYQQPPVQASLAMAPSTADNITESSFTELENLTELHNDSGLLLPHQSRHTKTGFLVQGGLLNDYVPTPPSKRPKGSWVWKDGHGEAITSTTTEKSYWLCKACYNQPQKQVVVYPVRPTTGPQRHMEKHGYQLDGIRMVVKRKVNDTQLTQQDIRDFKRAKQQSNAQETTFDVDEWKAHFIRWVVADDVSLRRAASAVHKGLLTYRNPIVEPVIPASHNTVRSWLIEAYKMNKKLVKRNLAQARSRITLSFDGWKSDNEVDYLGIVAHYIDKDFTVKAVLLALKNTFGNHTGLEMKEHLREACKDYKISTRIAYFMADNATPNDKAIELLAEHLELQPRK